MSDELAEFLKARFAEDIARQQDIWEKWHHRGCEAVPDVLYPERETGSCTCGVPERIIAETEAKRRMVEDTWGGPDHQDMWEHHMRLLALPYVSHPDYREEWKP